MRRISIRRSTRSCALACDNIVAMSMVSDEAEMAWRMRHISVRRHLLHQAVHDAEVRLTEVPELHAKATASGHYTDSVTGRYPEQQQQH